MPVATQASLKGLTPKQLEETGCRLCLNNTYHLYAEPLSQMAVASWTGKKMIFFLDTDRTDGWLTLCCEGD